MKKTSYQKLKAENKKLMGDIYNLVMRPDSMEGLKTAVLYDTKFSGVHQIMAGSRSSLIRGGILDQINKAIKPPVTNEPYFTKEDFLEKAEEAFVKYNEWLLNSSSKRNEYMTGVQWEQTEEEKVKKGYLILDEAKAVKLVKEGKMPMSELLKMDIKTKGVTPIRDFLQEINYNAFYPKQTKEEKSASKIANDEFMDKMNNMPIWQIKRPHINLIHPDDIEEEINEAIDQKEETK